MCPFQPEKPRFSEGIALLTDVEFQDSVDDGLEANIRKLATFSLGLASALGMAVLAPGCAAEVPVQSSQLHPVSARPPAADSCEYLNFDVLYSDPVGANRADPANDEILREVETIFSQALESAGFKRVRAGETPWLFLRALLRPSQLRSGAVTGAVQLGASPDLHRDYWSAVSEGSVGEGVIGMSLAVEIGARSGRLDPAATRLQEQVREKAHRVWEQSAPVLFALCNWRTKLEEDGLSVEDIRRELVEEMDRIRKHRHRQEQHKRLKLEVDGEI